MSALVSGCPGSRSALIRASTTDASAAPYGRTDNCVAVPVVVIPTPAPSIASESCFQRAPTTPATPAPARNGRPAAGPTCRRLGPFFVPPLRTFASALLPAPPALPGSSPPRRAVVVGLDALRAAPCSSTLLR